MREQFALLGEKYSGSNSELQKMIDIRNYTMEKNNLQHHNTIMQNKLENKNNHFESSKWNKNVDQ